MVLVPGVGHRTTPVPSRARTVALVVHAKCFRPNPKEGGFWEREMFHFHCTVADRLAVRYVLWMRKIL